MNKLISPISLIKRIIPLIHSGNCEDALHFIVNNNLYYKDLFSSIAPLLVAIDCKAYGLNHPGALSTLHKIQNIAELSILHTKLLKHQSELFEKLNEESIAKEESLKALFFICHLSTISELKEFPVKANKECLSAVKEIHKQLPNNGKGRITENGCDILYNLWVCTIDILNNLKNFELIIYSDYTLKTTSSNNLEIVFESKINSHSFLRLEYYKKKIEKSIRKQDAEASLKDEEYIKHIDKTYNSANGFPGIIHNSGAKVISNTPGITSIQAPDELFPSGVETNEDIAAIGSQLFLLFFKAYFHYNIRNIIKGVYDPALKINIKQSIQIQKNISFTVYELFLIVASILTYIEIKQTYAIKIQMALSNFKQYQTEKYPEIQEENFAKYIIPYLFQLYLNSQESITNELILSEPEENIFSLLGNIEDLKNRNTVDLKAALLFLSDTKSKLPFSILYKLNDSYYSYSFKHQSGEYIQQFYNYLITDNLFNIHNKATKNDDNSCTREKEVCKYLSELFLPITKNKIANLDFPSDLFGDKHGEKDFFAYSKQENILFYAEIKLSNTFARQAKRKKEWIEENVYNIGVRQISNTIDILKTNEGLDFLGNVIGIKKLSEKKPAIYAYIICDCYYEDHLKVPLPNSNKHFTVINIFEIENIIKCRKIHTNQHIDLSPIQKRQLKRLIDIIEEDTFWNFVYNSADSSIEEFECQSIKGTLSLKTIV